MIAPLFDCINASGNYIFEGHLTYGDTNHSKAGYDLDIVLSSHNSTDEINQLFSRLESLNLNPQC